VSGGDVGLGEGGERATRTPQSVQSIPNKHAANSAPGPPSSQSPSLAYGQPSVQVNGATGGDGGSAGDGGQAGGAGGGKGGMGGCWGDGGAGGSSTWHGCSISSKICGSASLRTRPATPVCRVGRSS